MSTVTSLPWCLPRLRRSFTKFVYYSAFEQILGCYVLGQLRGSRMISPPHSTLFGGDWALINYRNAFLFWELPCFGSSRHYSRRVNRHIPRARRPGQVLVIPNSAEPGWSRNVAVCLLAGWLEGRRSSATDRRSLASAGSFKSIDGVGRVVPLGRFWAFVPCDFGNNVYLILNHALASARVGWHSG